MDPFRKLAARERDDAAIRARSTSLGRARTRFELDSAQRRRVYIGITAIPAMFCVTMACARIGDAMLAVLFCAAAYCALAFASAWPRLTTRVVLHEDGVCVERGRRAGSMVFDDVDEVWYELQSREVPAVRSLRLKAHDGSELSVPLEYPNAKALFEAIVERCSLGLREDALRSLEAGEKLTFGSVVVGSKAITVRATHIPWSEVAKVEFGRAAIELYCGVDLGWQMVRYDQIPHPALLIDLVRHLGPAPTEPPITLGAQA